MTHIPDRTVKRARQFLFQCYIAYFRKFRRRSGSLFPLRPSMLPSLPLSLLRKMTLWHVVISMLLAVAHTAVHAEEFGISRRAPAQSQQRPSQEELPYVVRIIAFDAGGQSFGTGSYVGSYGEYGIILTNWHVIKETKVNERLVHVHFPPGFSSFGAIIKSDEIWDLALIAISKPPQSIPLLPISQTPPKSDDPLWIAGFGSGAYRIAEGRCVRYLALPDMPDKYEIVEVSVSARKGDSGGPILNQKGELAGVLFGSDMVRHTAGSYCVQVNRFLSETRPEIERLPNRPETCFASIEQNGPLYSLRESRYAVPQNIPLNATSQNTSQNNTSQNTAPQRSEFSGSSSSSFGIRPSSRRYAAPASGEQPHTQQQVPQQRQGTATPGTPISSLLPIQGMQPVSVVQVARRTPYQEISPAMEHFTAIERYQLKLFTDRNDLFFTLFMPLNACLALGLSCIAIRFLFLK